ncbi:MAG: ROK family protein [Acidobacteriota bacterium]
MKAIGVDIGGTHIKSAVVDLVTGRLEPASVAHAPVDNKASAESVLSRWATTIGETLAAAREEELAGIGFAMPGPFNYRTATALFKGNDKYENLYGLKVAERLRPLLAMGREKPLRFHNDASCFAIGEDGYGEAKAHDRFMAITLGTGFGSAFVSSGRLLTSGESVPENGCLWHLPFEGGGGGIADAFFSTRWFLKEHARRTGEELAGVKELARQHPSSRGVQRLFEEFGENLGRFLGPWILGFRPEIVVMGGSISRASEYFSESLHAALQAQRADLPLVPSTLHEEAAIVGSARLLDDAYYSIVKNDLPTL